MRSDSPQGHEVGQAATPAEDEALGVIKAMLPDAAIAWAWSNLLFISVHGRLAEVDLLLLTRAGLTLVELKGWHGRITGNQRTWRVGVEERANPLFLTDQKAKWLKELLAYVQPGPRRVPVPFIKAITVLHGRDSVVDLDPVAASPRSVEADCIEPPARRARVSRTRRARLGLAIPGRAPVHHTAEDCARRSRWSDADPATTRADCESVRLNCHRPTQDQVGCPTLSMAHEGVHEVAAPPLEFWQPSRSES